jgi:pilus assembly protein Flp/PilA
MTGLMVSMLAFVAGVKDKFGSEKGATATEYALLLGLIAIALVAAVGGFTGALNGFFGRIQGRVALWAP